MTQKDKELLLKDLCARLPYGVLCYINDDDTSTPRKLRRIEVDELDGILLDFWTDREDCHSMQVYLSEVKPYLRSMSSMTEEESKEYTNIDNRSYSCPIDYAHIPASDRIDWLLKNHFDYRGLIPKGLAIEVTEENNPYNLD